jgi:hypothetical protein
MPSSLHAGRDDEADLVFRNRTGARFLFRSGILQEAQNFGGPIVLVLQSVAKWSSGFVSPQLDCFNRFLQHRGAVEFHPQVGPQFQQRHHHVDVTVVNRRKHGVRGRGSR